MRLACPGVDIAYDDTGSDADTVVLLHGLGSARSTWHPLVGSVAQRARVLAVDQRGHGDSSHAPGTYTLPHYVADAIAVCDAVTNPPVVMVGHSLGAVVAASAARLRPDLVRGVLLEDPPLYRGDSVDPQQNPAVAFFAMLRQVTLDMQARHAGVDDYEGLLRVAPSPNGAGSFADVLGPAGTRALAQSLATIDPEVFAPVADGSGLDGVQPDAPLACPIRVLRADPSLGGTFTDADEARFRLSNPHAHIDVVHGASHFIHDEHPERFLAEVHAFLDSL
jgi:pimeloyl-ACP methyl ester carboxylesterase